MKFSNLSFNALAISLLPALVSARCPLGATTSLTINGVTICIGTGFGKIVPSGGFIWTRIATDELCASRCLLTPGCTSAIFTTSVSACTTYTGALTSDAMNDLQLNAGSVAIFVDTAFPVKSINPIATRTVIPTFPKATTANAFSILPACPASATEIYEDRATLFLYLISCPRVKVTSKRSTITRRQATALLTAHSKAFTSCIHACSVDKGCQAVNFNPSTGNCFLYTCMAAPKADQWGAELVATLEAGIITPQICPVNFQPRLIHDPHKGWSGFHGSFWGP